jgi:hypothetical protein
LYTYDTRIAQQDVSSWIRVLNNKYYGKLKWDFLFNLQSWILVQNLIWISESLYSYVGKYKERAPMSEAINWYKK